MPKARKSPKTQTLAPQESAYMLIVMDPISWTKKDPFLR
jgi:hypothetical protein